MSKPQPTTDYTLGKMLYRCQQPKTMCRTLAQEFGYERAEKLQPLATQEQSPVDFWKSYNEGSFHWRTCEDAFSRIYKDEDVEIYIDLYADTVQVDLYGVRILDTRPFFNNIPSQRPEYHFQGVDYEQPSIQ